ncbi:ribonuclease inhibitor [Phyllobacterium sp. SB3]|uniref:barstar family protein n=1 Tax=Phyllobacterium sp. SB3 TaxID=3156073 RepID=UPI0032AEA34E
MTDTFTIDGKNVSDISSFYDEINRVFMADEDWKLGPSLDALNDMFHGGVGAIKGNGPVTLIWKEMEKNRTDLGVEVTRRFYLGKLESPEQYDVMRIKRDLAELENGTGPTYFEIVLQVIADHPNITLLPR